MISAINFVIAENKLDIRSTFPYLDMVELEQHEIEAFDPNLLSFKNINTMEDLKELKLTL